MEQNQLQIFHSSVHKELVSRIKEQYGLLKIGKNSDLTSLIQYVSRISGGGKLKNLTYKQALVLAQRALSRVPMHLTDAIEICPPKNPHLHVRANLKLLNLAKAVQKKTATKLTVEGFISEIQNEFVNKRFLARYRDKDFYKTKEWRELRLLILDAQRACRLCGRSPDSGAILHVDHIKPRSIYPELSFEPANLQILCSECNMTKSNLLHKAY